MMSGQKRVKSLSLSRKTQNPPPRKQESRTITEDDESYALSNIEAASNSPISRSSRLCSTPNDKNVVDIPEDSPDQDHYRCSPESMFPCTQDSTLIAWDWSSGINKPGTSFSISNCDKLNDRNIPTSPNKTPKRPKHNFHKKRTAKAYSPLLNMPSKRRRSHRNVTSSMKKLVEELKAVSDTMKINENQETNEKKNENEDNLEATDSRDPQIYNTRTQKILDIHGPSASQFSYNVEEEKTDPGKIDSSLDDMFNDDVDNACILKCSREIENELTFNSDINRTESVINLSNQDEKTVVHGERKIGSGIPETLSDSNIGAKSSGMKNIETGFHKKTIEEGESSSLKLENDKLDTKKLNGIPESEMDDSLALSVADAEWIEHFLEDTVSSEPSTPGKSNSLSDLNYIRNDWNAAIKIDKDDEVASSSSNLKRKQQCINNENSSASTSSEGREYLKSKSFSDSYCGNSMTMMKEKNDKTSLTNIKENGSTSMGERNYSPPIKKSTSNFNLSTNMKGKMNGIENKVSSTIKLNKLFPAAGSRNDNNTNTKSNDNNNNNLTMKQQNSNTKVTYSYLRTSKENLVWNKSSNIIDPYSKRDHNDMPLKELRTTVPTMSQQLSYELEEIDNKRFEAKENSKANRLRKQISSRNLKSDTGVVKKNSMRNKKPLINK